VPQDRFAVLNFATTVNRYHDGLQSASADAVASARKWVDTLEASGGTAIDDALAAALALRSDDATRTFTVVFFTDGRPTIGETAFDKILQNVSKRNTASTRIFTFGVGDDVNAAMLDQLAEQTRSVSTYVRESEDIEAKVSSLYGKISNPVLANLKLSVGEGVKINEVYPPQLPDLFHGSQLTVLGRYDGKGHAAIKLIGSVGQETKEFVYELNFADKTEDKTFVEDLWARRKVGYMLDQIRVNGEKKELVDEVVNLAKRYGITTPYTSYLVVPDQPVPVVRFTAPKAGGVPGPERPAAPPALQGGGFGGASSAPGGSPAKLEDFARKLQTAGAKAKGGLGAARGQFEADRLDREARDLKQRLPMATNSPADKRALEEAAKNVDDQTLRQKTLMMAFDEIRRRNLQGVQEGQLGVNYAVQMNQLRSQERVTNTANRIAQNRNLIELGGVWIDEAFDAKMPSVTIKAQSKAYFRMLERHPKMREVFQLGNWVVWVTPSGTALIIDRGSGREEMPDADIDRLFVAPTPPAATPKK
jgi:Ca-activated chloride channel family protein